MISTLKCLSKLNIMKWTSTNLLIITQRSFSLRTSWQIFDILRSRLNARCFEDLKKIINYEHKIFLSMDHPFQHESNHLLNGLEENCPPPSQTTTNVRATLWKKVVEIHWKHMLETLGLRDPIMVIFLSALFFNNYAFHTLEYWPKLFIHHLLDSMHIVKNVCKSLLKHLKQTLVHPTWRSLFGHLNPML